MKVGFLFRLQHQKMEKRKTLLATIRREKIFVLQTWNALLFESHEDTLNKVLLENDVDVEFLMRDNKEVSIKSIEKIFKRVRIGKLSFGRSLDLVVTAVLKSVEHCDRIVFRDAGTFISELDESLTESDTIKKSKITVRCGSTEALIGIFKKVIKVKLKLDTLLFNMPELDGDYFYQVDIDPLLPLVEIEEFQIHPHPDNESDRLDYFAKSVWKFGSLRSLVICFDMTHNCDKVAVDVWNLRFLRFGGELYLRLPHRYSSHKLKCALIDLAENTGFVRKLTIELARDMIPMKDFWPAILNSDPHLKSFRYNMDYCYPNVRPIITADVIRMTKLRHLRIDLLMNETYGELVEAFKSSKHLISLSIAHALHDNPFKADSERREGNFSQACKICVTRKNGKLKVKIFDRISFQNGSISI